MCVCHVGLCTSVQCLQRPEERNGSPGAGVTGGHKAHVWVLGMELWTSLQPQTFHFTTP